MTVTDDLLANNARYAETFDKGDLPLPPYLLLSDPNTSVHSPKGRLVATGMEPDSGC